VSEHRRLGRSEVLDLLGSSGIRPSKALGQNFVIDPNLTERIARIAAVGPGDRVLEIGPGLGSLTLALHATGAGVTAVEIDHRLCEVLRRTLPSDVRVVQADATSLDVAKLYAVADDVGPGSVVLVANLPYNVATPLVMHVLENAPLIGRLLVMVQREVAERFVARPGSKIYGAVSVRIAYFAETSLEGPVPPDVFYPRPNVTSALIEITRRAQPLVKSEVASYEEIVTLVRHGFATRRKMLRRSLAGLVNDEVFAAAGVLPTARAEELGVLEWGELARWRRSIMSTQTPS
jgi:16S rRNA (adenine1518-N6/adenine1519-N6)-dimethyltransferase